MREILFRAKHIHVLPQNEHLDGEWVYGYLGGKNYIYSEELESDFLVDPETVCQYTGLTDKNGKKIFEGDIVKAGGNLVVKWNEKFASWCLSKEGWMYNHFFGEAVAPEDCEVIGNIFDNPDLLTTSFADSD